MSMSDLSFEHVLSSQYTVFDGLAGMHVEDIYQDRQGFLWIATADGGVSRFDSARFDTFGIKDGLPAAAAFFAMMARPSRVFAWGRLLSKTRSKPSCATTSVGCGLGREQDWSPTNRDTRRRAWSSARSWLARSWSRPKLYLAQRAPQKSAFTSKASASAPARDRCATAIVC